MTHKDPVSAVAFSPDGKTIATGSYDKTARLWNAADGSPIGAPMTHQDWVWRVAFSPDGKTIVTGSRDKTARLWRVPQPISGSPRRISLWVEVVTGFTFDEESSQIRALSNDNWAKRRHELDALGGPPEL
jgi:WD40 repeat protein